MTIQDSLLQEQIAYYRARAGEYDEWFLRQGRYDRGEEANARWFAEVQTVATALDDFAPTGDVLELACGTGLWTQRLARYATTLTALDSSPETLEVNKRRLADATHVRYEVADLFAWQPEQRYDVVFFSFWLSHVPPDRFEPFFQSVAASLAPGGRIFFIDSLYTQTSTAHDHVLTEPAATTLTRRLNDGREFQVVKVFYEPAELESRLRTLGWNATVQTSGEFFLYGSGEHHSGGRAP